MTILRNASSHLIAAATALALSLVLISGTVATPVSRTATETAVLA